MRLIQFLNEKNHFLEKFCELNEHQITRLNGGDFDDIERFYRQREDLLKIIKYIDSEIQISHGAHRNSAIGFTEVQRSEIRESLRAKEMYVRKIIEQDLVVLGAIDDAKTKIIKELQEVQRAKKALAGYKSPAA